jgi:hypothetical protein
MPKKLLVTKRPKRRCGLVKDRELASLVSQLVKTSLTSGASNASSKFILWFLLLCLTLSVLMEQRAPGWAIILLLKKTILKSVSNRQTNLLTPKKPLVTKRPKRRCGLVKERELASLVSRLAKISLTSGASNASSKFILWFLLLCLTLSVLMEQRAPGWELILIRFQRRTALRRPMISSKSMKKVVMK